MVLLLVISCQNNRYENVDALVAKETMGEQWEVLDRLPRFTACDPIHQSSKIKCFQKGLYAYLSLDSVLVKQEHLTPDTVQLDLVIHKSGEFRLKSITTKNTSQGQDLTSILSNYLRQLKPVEPAYKRGIPVDLRLEIPVIIK